jgi:suppressor for copper-sensitivity B
LKRRVLIALGLVWLGVLAAVPAREASAVSGGWVSADQLSGRLVSSVEGTGTAATIAAGLELKLKDGWKTYWRTPGDAGLPPELDWSKSQNVQSLSLAYPKPIRFQLFGLQTFGYEKHVVFPLTVMVDDPGQPVTLNVTATVLVCEQVCIPQTLDLSLSVPAGDATVSSHAHLIQRYQSQVSVAPDVAGIEVQSVETKSISGEQALTVKVAAEQPFVAPDVLVEIDPYVAFKAPMVALSADRRTATFDLPLAQPLPAGQGLAGQTATLSILDRDRAAEVKQVIGQGPAAGSVRATSVLLTMVLFAFAGGFILNLMPCVLPVLSIKLMSLVKAQDLSPRDIRTKFLATAAGIITSLLVLALILLAVKAAGLAVGWGIQFQQPVFITLLALIVGLFAFNLWGLFEINLPPAIGNWAGQQGEGSTSLLGHFLTGVFVTLLATPCSAPFVGTAVGFALASDAVSTLVIFLCLGLGLASPYVLVALVPSLAHKMPRPGHWMVTLRWILGFALAATAIWLLSVLAQQSGAMAALAVAGALVVMALVLAWRKSRPNALTATAAAGLIALTTVGAIAAPSLLGQTPVETGVAGGSAIEWQAFDRGRIRGLVAQGQTVFVDVTADWCITCQANKRLVMRQPPVLDRLRSETNAMQADWTSPDPRITEFLKSFGRFGIPLNVVFGPGAPQGIVLPELLTSDAVTDALDRASRGGRRSDGKT